MAVAVTACSSARSSTGSTGSTDPITPSNRSSRSSRGNRSSSSTRSPERAGTATSRPRRQEAAAAAGVEAAVVRPERRRRPSQWEPTSAPRVGRARACAGAEEVGAVGVAGAGGRAPVRSCALRVSIYRARATRNCEFYAKRVERMPVTLFRPGIGYTWSVHGVYMEVKGPGRGHTNSNHPKIKRRPKQTTLIFCLSVCCC